MERHLGRPLRENEHVHHLNGNKLDNRIENLELLDGREHRRKHGFAKLNVEEVRQIRDLHAQGVSQHELARRYGVGPAAIFKIVHRQRWKDV